VRAAAPGVDHGRRSHRGNPGSGRGDPGPGSAWASGGASGHATWQQAIQLEPGRVAAFPGPSAHPPGPYIGQTSIPGTTVTVGRATLRSERGRRRSRGIRMPRPSPLSLCPPGHRTVITGSFGPGQGAPRRDDRRLAWLTGASAPRPAAHENRARSPKPAARHPATPRVLRDGPRRRRAA